MKRLLIIIMVALAGATFACGQTSQQMSDNEARMYIMKHLEKLRVAFCQKDITSIREMFKEDGLFLVKKPIMREKNGHTVSVDTVMKVSRNHLLKSLKSAFSRNGWIDVKFTSMGDDGGYVITQSKIDPTKYGALIHVKVAAERYSDEGYVFLLWEFPKDGGSPIIHALTWQPEMVAGQNTQPDPDITTLSGFGL